MMGDGDGDNISMISEADSQMSVNTAAAATRLPTVQDFLYGLGIKNKEFHVDKVGSLTSQKCTDFLPFYQIRFVHGEKTAR